MTRNQSDSKSVLRSPMGRLRIPVMLGIAMIGLLNAPAAANAQLSQDVREVFEGMMDSLDEDLQEKFEAAIRDDTDKIEFSADEFERFREHPGNPFEGLDRIKVRPGTNIALKFALPSMRNRPVDSLERQNPGLLNQLGPPAMEAAASTVRVFAEDRHIAMGVVVHADGYVMTKASELEGRDEIQVRLPGGKTLPAEVVRSDEEHDVAILHIAASGLKAVQWSSSEPKLGSFLLTPDANGKVLAMGAYSVRPRSTNQGEQAFLGVQPVETAAGVQVLDVRPEAASYKAGLRSGDIVLEIEDETINDVAGIVQAIRQHRPGDQIRIKYRRGSDVRSTTATLAGQQLSGARAARFKMMNRLGAVPSRRDGNFPSVFQHDTPLFPEQCGGPIVDLDGNVVGINIARRGRAASFAIPAQLASTLVQELLRKDLASNPKRTQ